MKHIALCLCAVTAVLCLMTACEETVPAVSDGFGRVPGEAHTTPATEAVPPVDNTITVCVDPGPGFDDVGTGSDYLGEWSEKDVTLSIATVLKTELEARGYRVHMLHDGVNFPRGEDDDGNNLLKPSERIALIREADIDYYVSVHCDAYAADESVMGTRIYYSAGTSFTKESKSSASDIMNAINSLLPDAKKARVIEKKYDEAYYVIREAPVPSTLIEVGFVTNPTDAANMLDESWRRTIAKGIAAGIDEFFAE